MKRFFSFIIITSFVFFNLNTLSASSNTQAEFYNRLTRYMKFSPNDIISLERGQVIVKNLERSSKKEVGVFGITEVPTSSDFFVEQFKNIELFKKSRMVLQIAKFSNAPQIEDLKRLSLTGNELDSLRKCKSGKCEMKLSRGTIERFRKEINWSKPEAKNKALLLFRASLLDYLQTYLKNGKTPEYHDKKHPFKHDAEFNDLLKGSQYLREQHRDFYEYLMQFPRIRSNDVENFFYWSKEQFGLKPVVTITHVAIYKERQTSFKRYLIASKQIYANHYFNTSLGLTETWEEPSSIGNPTFYLMYLNRSRSDMLGGIFGGLKRSIVKSRSKNGLQQNLKIVRERLTQEFQATSMKQ